MARVANCIMDFDAMMDGSCVKRPLWRIHQARLAEAVLDLLGSLECWGRSLLLYITLLIQHSGAEHTEKSSRTQHLHNILRHLDDGIYGRGLENGSRGVNLDVMNGCHLITPASALARLLRRVAL